MSEEGVRGVVVGHGAIASGLVDAVKRIAGIPDDVLVSVSNEGKGHDALKEELARIAAQGTVVVFTDMHAGQLRGGGAGRLPRGGRARGGVRCEPPHAAGLRVPS